MVHKSNNEFILKIRNVAVIVTIVCFSYMGYVLYEKYLKLESAYRSKIGSQIYDEIFCCDFSYDDEERKNQEIADKYNSEKVDPKTVDHWIKIKLSKMGGMDSSLYNYYFRTWERELVIKEIIDYKIKCEQKIVHEQFELQRDSFNYVRGIQYEKAINQKAKEANIFSFFSIPYLIGSFLGTIAIPLIFWIIWYYYKFLSK